MVFAFILGSNPALSLAEIISVLEKERTEYSILSFSNEALVLEVISDTLRVKGQTPLGCKEFIKKLGGTIKIVGITKEIKKEDFPEDFRLLLSHSDLVYPERSRRKESHCCHSGLDPESISHHSGETSFDGERSESTEEDIKKIKFGISLYFINPTNKLKRRVEGSLKAMAINLKKEFQEKGIKTGFISKKERNLSSVSVQKNGLLKNDGLEICIFLDQEKIYIGKTISVQDFEEYSERDFGRLKRDLISGTTPPKLAKIMINLAGKNPSSFWQAEGTGQNQNSSASISFIDPFCGSGTFINEAYILGFKDIYGTDKSEKAISDTKENLDWLKKYLLSHSGLPARFRQSRINSALGEGGSFPFLSLSFLHRNKMRHKLQQESSLCHSDTEHCEVEESHCCHSDLVYPERSRRKESQKEPPNIHIFQSDAKEISKKIKPSSIDLVVTESYLGKPLTKNPNKEEAQKILSELSKLYIDSLKEIKKILKKDGVVVIALPAFRVGEELILTPIDKELEELGYKFVNTSEVSSRLLRGEMEYKASFRPFLTPRNTFLYSRKDQIVLREVMVLET